MQFVSYPTTQYKSLHIKNSLVIITIINQVLDNIMWYTKLGDVLKTNKHQQQQSNNILISRDHQYEGSSKVVKQFQYVPITDIPTKNIHAYELIPSDQPRYFYADLDLTKANPLFNTTSTTDMINATLSLINNVLKTEFKIKPSILDPIVLTVPNEEYKKSAHIIWPNIILENVTATKYLAQVIKHHIQQPTESILASTLDFAVYRSNQNFRLAGQSKWGKDDSYILVPTDKTLEPKDCLVGYYDQSNNKDTNNAASPYTILPKLQEKATKYAQVTKDDHFDAVFDTRTMKQTKTSTHENPFEKISHIPAFKYLGLIHNSNESPQSYNVWWSIGQALKNIAACDAIDSQDVLAYLEAWITWSNQASITYPNEVIECTNAWRHMNASRVVGLNLAFLRDMAGIAKANPIDELFDTSLALAGCDFITYEEYNSKYVRPYKFKKYNLIIIKGPMGNGKTYQMGESINEFMTSSTPFKRILIISPRRTFSKEKVAEFRRICPDFIDYQSKEVQESLDWNKFDKIAIQVESLHRLNASTYDLIICDEMESILSQFSSTTHNMLEKSFESFVSVFTQSTRVICADAFISNRTLEFVKNIAEEHNHIGKLFGQHEDQDKYPVYKRILFENNTFNPNSETRVNILGIANSMSQVAKVKNKFISHLIKALLSGKKICVVCAILDFKKEIIPEYIKVLAAQGLGEDAINESILSYDSECSDHFITNLANVKTTWADPKVRLVIYTTCITVGINFDVPDIFNSIYIYGSNACPISRDLMQAHFRVRHIIDKVIHVAIITCATHKKGGTNLDAIKAFHGTINNHIDGTGTSMRAYNYLQRLYSETAAHNSHEEILGFKLYARLFFYFLREIGYRLPEDLTKETEEEIVVMDTFVIADTTVVPVKKTKVIKDKQKHAKPSLLSYQTFIKVINLEDKDIKIISDRMKISDATSEDKESALAFFFYKSILRVIDYTDYTSQDQEQYMYDVYPLYTEYSSNIQVRSQVDNIVTEMSKNVYQVINWAHNRVQASKEQAVRFSMIVEICEIVGIRNTFDTYGQIGDKELGDFDKFYSKNKGKIVKLFNIRFQGKQDTDTSNLRKSIFIISAIFRAWSGFELKVLESDNQNSNCKDQNKNYICKVVPKKKNGCVDIFTWNVFNKLPRGRFMSNEPEEDGSVFIGKSWY